MHPLICCTVIVISLPGRSHPCDVGLSEGHTFPQFVCLVQLRAFSFAKGGLVAAQEMHAALLGAVVRAPLSFFNRTPPGRVLNRHVLLSFCKCHHCNAVPCSTSSLLECYAWSAPV